MLKSIPSRKLVPLQELNKDASKKEHLLNQKLDQLSRLVHKLNHLETNNHHTHNTTHYHHQHHNHSHNTNERQKLLDRIQTLDKEAQQLLNELVSLNHRMNHVNQQQQQQQKNSMNGSSSDDDDSDDDASEKKRLLHDNSNSSSSSSSSDEMIELPVHMRDQIHQHGQTMNDMQRELQKWRMSVQRSNMLYSPINNNNSNNGSGNNDGGMSELDRLNRTTADGDAILSIDDSASRLLDQAHEIRGNMSYQRMLISGANAKLGGMRARFPVIDGMIVRIQQKRQRDMVALSFFIAFCVIVTWFLL